MWLLGWFAVRKEEFGDWRAKIDEKARLFVNAGW